MDSESFEQEYDEKPKREAFEDIGGAPEPDSVPAPRRGGCAWPLLVALGCLGACAACCVLPFCALVITGAGFAAILSNSEATQSGTETVTLDPDTIITLAVDNSVGSIDIRPGSEDRVEVAYTKKAYGLTKGQAQDELDNITVSAVKAADDRVEITVDNRRSEDSFWTFANSVELTITVPEALHIAIESDVGSVDIPDVRARSLDISTSTGSVTFDGDLLPGASSEYLIETRTGAIRVTLPRDAYVTLDARSDVGGVTVSDAFDKRSNVNYDQQTVGEEWTGTLGEGGEDAPMLTLRANTGSIRVEAR